MLNVQGAHEERTEHPDGEERPHDVRHGARTRAEDAQRHQRVAHPRLGQQERSRQGQGDGPEPQGVSRAPPPFARLHDRVDRDRGSGDREHGAEQVHAVPESESR